MIDEKSYATFMRLVYDQFGSGLKFIFAIIYAHITNFKLCEIIGGGDIILVYTQELNKRKDHLDFVRKIADVNKGVCVHVYRRRFSLSRIFRMGFGVIGVLENAGVIAGEISKNKPRMVILFCVHLYFSYALNKILQAKGIFTSTLQHGLYKYPKNKYELYKSATHCDAAFIFDKKYSEFFEGCREIYVPGYYLRSSKRAVTDRVVGNVFYLTYFDDLEMSIIVNAILKNIEVKSSNYIIFHPNQKLSSRRLFLSLIGERGWFAESKKWVLADRNYFYNTTTYLKIDFKYSDFVYSISDVGVCEEILVKPDEFEIGKLSSMIDLSLSA